MVDGSKIRALREKAGLTQAELANKVGVEQTMITYIERGVKRPSVELFIRIADYFGVSTDELRKKESE